MISKHDYVILRMVMVCLLACVCICGCCSHSEVSGDSRVIAKINNYELTVSDFEREAGTAMARRYMPADREAAKEEILDRMIEKQMLLQEAQRQDFDKDRAFMDEIQSYWEQALLKLLLKKKSDELSVTVKPEDREKALEDWEVSLRDKAKIKIDQKLLKEIKLEQSDKMGGR